MRQSRNKAVRIGKFRGGNTLFVCCIETAVTDIVHNGTAEEVRLLKHHADGGTQRRFRDSFDIKAVIGDRAALNIVEPGDEIGDSRLSCTRGSDKCDLLTGFRIETDIIQNDLAFDIGELDILETNIPAHSRQGIAVLRIFPRPNIGAVVDFLKAAVFLLFSKHQCDIAFIHFRI